MPYYKVRCKTDADPDGRLWPLGQFSNRDEALGTFNSDARKEGIGPLTFDETSPFLPHHHLVEQEMLNGPEVMFPLYKATQPN
jgi:hypothetical protein